MSSKRKRFFTVFCFAGPSAALQDLQSSKLNVGGYSLRKHRGEASQAERPNPQLKEDDQAGGEETYDCGDPGTETEGPEKITNNRKNKAKGNPNNNEIHKGHKLSLCTREYTHNEERSAKKAEENEKGGALRRTALERTLVKFFHPKTSFVRHCSALP